MSDMVIEMDRFADAMDGILTDVHGKLKVGARKSVAKGAKVAKRDWVANAPKKTGAYAASITYRVNQKSDEVVTAEVGSKTMPGLPHLMEKGHAIVGGGRSHAFVHIAPAADEAFKTTTEAIEGIEL